MSRKLTTEEFIKKAIKIHGDKYNYNEVKYINNKIKVKIICPDHGIFFQIPNSHLSGSRCLGCSNNKKLNTKEFIEKAIKIHGNKYDYSEVKYKNTHKKVKIKCYIHGVFKQEPNNHLSGQGCLDCSGNKKLNTKEFIKKAIKIHGDKYDYSRVEYINMRTKIKIICPNHGIFLQTPNNHLSGQGCSICSYKISKPSQEWLDKFGILKENREKYIKVGSKIFIIDGFDPNTNTVYEFNGDYWHGNPNKFNPENINIHNKKTFGELYNKTIEKQQLLEKAGYNVISIWESEYKNENK